MMEDHPCESFELLDLLHVSTHGDEEPESSESITSESPNFTTEPVSSSNPRVSLTIFHSFLRCIQGKRPFQNKSRSKNPTQTLGMKSRPSYCYKKGTKECTNQPIYPLSHYVSLKHLSPAHTNFIVSLNTTINPNTISSALEKNKAWEIVERPKWKNIGDCKWIFTRNIRLMDLLRSIKQDW
ncbi:hypothetical protein AAG906_020164 [Vitis piasezkii]